MNNTINQVLHVTPQGDDIYLTIDSRIEKTLVRNFLTEAPIDNNSPFKTDRGNAHFTTLLSGTLFESSNKNERGSA